MSWLRKHFPGGLIAVWLACLLALPGLLQAQELQPVPALSARVVDGAGLLDPAARAALEAKLAAIERDKGAQVVFLLVPTTAPEDIASYANRIGNAWKIGRQGVGDGVLLVVARDDRKMRLEVAKTLEGAIPDLAAKSVIDDALTPAFRRGDYAAGLDAAADRLGALIRGEALPPVNDREAAPLSAQLEDLAIFLFVAVPIVAAALRGLLGRKLAVPLTAGATGALAWFVTASVLATGLAVFIGALVSLVSGSPLGRELVRQASRRHHGGWGTPGGWGSGGSWGGGSGGGGFSSGGGGDFGGGGASGDW